MGRSLVVVKDREGSIAALEKLQGVLTDLSERYIYIYIGEERGFEVEGRDATKYI